MTSQIHILLLFWWNLSVWNTAVIVAFPLDKRSFWNSSKVTHSEPYSITVRGAKGSLSFPWLERRQFWLPTRTSAALERRRFPILTNYNRLWCHISIFWHQDSQFDNFLHRSKKYVIYNEYENSFLDPKTRVSCLFKFFLITPHSSFVLFRLAPNRIKIGLGLKNHKIKNSQKYVFEIYNFSSSVIFLYLRSKHTSPKFEGGHVVECIIGWC